MDNVQKNAIDGKALAEVKNHQGWKQVEQIIADEYKACVLELIEKESLEARAKITAWETLAERIEYKIKLGEQCAEELKKRVQANLATP